jgi:cobalt/nickel transport system permease protein
MRHDFFDRYSRLDSPVHRLPAVLKLAMTLSTVVAIVVMPLALWPFFLLTALLLIAVAAVSRIPPWFLVTRLLMFEPVVLGVAVLAIFQPGGEKIFAAMAVRTTLCLFTVILLSNTTPFTELLQVLQRAHMPALMITTLALMYRYLFVITDEAQRMKRARASRTFMKGRLWEWRLLATVIGQLFVRTTERAERIYMAMCARGWK